LNWLGWVREPILHFLLLGLGLFIVYSWLNPDEAIDSRVIEINRESLGQFIEFRTRSFNGNAGEKLDSLSPKALSDIVDQYITEEALYRRALNYGMDRQDYVIKRRLVQKMEFLAEGTKSPVNTLTSADLEQFYAQHQADYEVPAAVTFTHVFISVDRHGPASKSMALEMLARLNNRNVRFDQAPNFGDRFPYQLNYVEKTQDEVGGHFGRVMASQLFDLAVEQQAWQGPLSSAFGEHLVLLTRKQVARIPGLDEVRNQIATELQRQRETERKKAVIETMISEFEVKIDPVLEAKIQSRLKKPS
jgi:hypothetical protein